MRILGPRQRRVQAQESPPGSSPHRFPRAGGYQNNLRHLHARALASPSFRHSKSPLFTLHAQFDPVQADQSSSRLSSPVRREREQSAPPVAAPRRARPVHVASLPRVSSPALAPRPGPGLTASLSSSEPPGQRSQPPTSGPGVRRQQATDNKHPPPQENAGARSAFRRRPTLSPPTHRLHVPSLPLVASFSGRIRLVRRQNLRRVRARLRDSDADRDTGYKRDSDSPRSRLEES